MTARETLLSAARALREAGVPDPEYDAGLLLSRVTGEPPLNLRAGFGRILSEAETAAFQALLSRRKNREPLQYLLGDAVFLGDFYLVGPGTLIPRPETEMLAEAGAAWLRRGGAAAEADVLDLCCGSGCLGIAVRRKCPGSRCTLTDLSPKALSFARANAERLAPDCRILAGDLFEPVRDAKFDLILSNPPYIPSGACETLQPEVTREPRGALDGGADGLDFYRRIAREAPAHLKPGGLLLLEIGFGQAEDVESLLRAHGLRAVKTEKDFAGIPRMVRAEAPSGENEETC